jgi:pimeloyl-ACP methyl ester carboxylesterase
LTAGLTGDASRPALLLVHGAWLGAWTWDTVQAELTARGWQVHTVDLPSVADVGGPRFGLYDDAALVARRIQDIGRPVVVVAHSYGGTVATQAAAGLTNVRHIVYVCAFPLDVGESLFALTGNLPWWQIDGDTVTTLGADELFFEDVPQEDSVRAIARLKPFSYAAITETLTAAAWRTVPSTYVVCDDDRSFPVAAQEAFAARATVVRRLPAGHLPMLSTPSALTDLIVEAADNA